MAKDEILVIKGESLYSVLDYAAELTAQAFVKQGYRLKTIDFSDRKTIADTKALTDTLLDEYKFIFSCQAIGFEQKLSNGEPLIKYIQAPYFGWIFDHPIYHKSRINNATFPHIYIGLIDNSHTDYIRSYHCNVNNFAFLPHGGFRCSERKRFRDKETDIFLPGSCVFPSSNEDDHRTMGELCASLGIIEYMADNLEPVTVFEAVENIKEKVINDSELPIHTAVKEYLTDEGSTALLTDSRLADYLINRVDRQLRLKCRVEGIEALVDAGYTVTVAGNGWEQIKSLYGDRICIVGHNGLGISENIKAIANSKICLNLFPSYPQGMHERLLTALLCGSSCITMGNDYLRREFRNIESLSYIDISDISEIVDKADSILTDKNIEDKLLHAYEYTCADHTWEARGDEILELFCKN